MKNYFLKLFIVAAVIAAFVVSCSSQAEVTVTPPTPPSIEASLDVNVAVQAAIATPEELAAFDDAKEKAGLSRSLSLEIGVPDAFEDEWNTAESAFNAIQAPASDASGLAVKAATELYNGAAATYDDLFRRIFTDYRQTQETPINAARASIESIISTTEFSADWQETELHFNDMKSRSVIPATVDTVKEVVSGYAKLAASYGNLIQNIIPLYQYEISAKQSLLVEIGIPSEYQAAWEQTESKLQGHVSFSSTTLDESVAEVTFYAEVAAEYDDLFQRMYPYANSSPELTARARGAFPNLREAIDAAVAGPVLPPPDANAPATADDTETLEAAKGRVRRLRSLVVEFLPPTQLPEEWNQADSVYIDPDSIPDGLLVENLMPKLEEAASAYEALFQKSLGDFVREQDEQVRSLKALALDAGAESKLPEQLSLADAKKDAIGDKLAAKEYADAKDDYALVQAMYRIVTTLIKALDVQDEIVDKRLHQWDSDSFDLIAADTRSIQLEYNSIASIQDAETLEEYADNLLEQCTTFLDTNIVKYAAEEKEKAAAMLETTREAVSDADPDSGFADDFDAAQIVYDSASRAFEAADSVIGYETAAKGYMEANALFEDVYQRALNAFAEKQDELVRSLKKLALDSIELNKVEKIFQKYLDLADKTTDAIADVLDGKTEAAIEKILADDYQGEKSVYAIAKELYAIAQGMYRFLPEAVEVYLTRKTIIDKGLARWNRAGFDAIDAFERSVMAEYTNRLLPAAEKDIVTVKERYFDFYEDTIEDYARYQQGVASNKRAAALAVRADSTVKDVFDGAQQVFNDADLIFSDGYYKEAADRYIEAADRFDGVLAAVDDRRKQSQDLLGKARDKVIESKDLARDAEKSVQGVTQW
ncbi:hypothetical protein FACS1894200_02300 [Spirochaetia bacterium]|nr:hypothetical protein FACS1894200_02300 [Spirochaetia bacterium]